MEGHLSISVWAPKINLILNMVSRLTVVLLLLLLLSFTVTSTEGLTAVSREAKKEQSKSPKTKCATNYCVHVFYKTHGSES